MVIEANPTSRWAAETDRRHTGPLQKSVKVMTFR
jgi:hypothetical protein